MSEFNLNRTPKHMLLWFVPAIVLLLSLLPVIFPYVAILLLQIIVSVAAAYISYLHFIEKPKNYLIWAIAFIVVVLVFNPIIQFSVMMNYGIPVALVSAILFLTNWWFVYRVK